MRTGSCAMASLWLMTMSIASSSAGQMVAGRVRDRESKRPLREVTVVLLADTGKSSHAAARATTDSLGIFYLTASSPGVYQLLFATANDTLLSGYLALAQDEMVQREFLLDTHATERAYFEFQVTRQVQPSPNNRPPRYPEALRGANMQGEVLVQFIVDTTGKPEMNTLKGITVDARRISDGSAQCAAGLRVRARDDLEQEGAAGRTDAVSLLSQWRTEPVRSTGYRAPLARASAPSRSLSVGSGGIRDRDHPRQNTDNRSGELCGS